MSDSLPFFSMEGVPVLIREQDVGGSSGLAMCIDDLMSCIAPRFPIRLCTQNSCLFVSSIVSLKRPDHSKFCICYLQKRLACCRLKELSMYTEYL